MKHPGGNPSTLFCEQVSTVTILFEKWNDCERAVVMYALLKRLSFPTLKFLQFSIESNLTQNFGSQKNLCSIETNANNPKYLQKLIGTYKTLPIVELAQIADKDSILYESDLYLTENDKSYFKKEDILHDILSMIPLLKPGNDDAKIIYLSLIPLAVEDTVRQIVAAELVQQIFSYLLIHPAISNDDRRSLSHWLRHLEDHIQSSFASTGQQSFYLLSNPHDNSTPPDSLNTSFSSMNGNNQNTWQAIAPPSQKQHHQQVTQQLSNLTMSSLNSASSTSSSDWNLNVLHLPPPIVANNPSSSQNSLGLVTVENNNESDSPPEDLHVSFSKNGTEVLDFDSSLNEVDTCNTQIASIGNHLNVPSNFGQFDNQMLAVKTRRSNSLTTPSTSKSANSQEETMHAGTSSNSSENLSQFAQKPRSYSLSIESPRNSLTSSGSETRLDDMKPNYLQFTTHNIGMSSIGQWLKSLRLHKYIGLFTNVTYEEMLGISEEYLQSLGVTKGASHKLALCIQKLQDRVVNLSTMETDLLEGRINAGAVIDEMSNIVLTPMKPIDNLSNDNVAGKFIHVLDIVSQIMLKREITSLHDEECVNTTLWVLERALHNEAFVTHTNQLKEYKFKLSKLKMHFTPKGHHSKNSGATSNINKPRWNSSTKIRKPDNNSKTGSSDRLHRKNSNDMPNFTLSSLQQQPSTSTIATNSQYSQECDNYQQSSSQQQHQQLQQPIQYYNTNSVTASSSNSSTNSQYKSSSYPSFANSSSSSGMPSHQSHQPQQQQQQSQQQQHQYRHRHSLNNLIVLSANPQQQQQVTFKTNKQSAGILTLNKKIRPTTTNLSKSIITLANVKSENQLLIPSATTITKIMPASLVSKKCCNNISSNSNSSSNRIGNLESLTKNSKNTIGDINSSLEFLCMQMTEQAIN